MLHTYILAVHSPAGSNDVCMLSAIAEQQPCGMVRPANSRCAHTIINCWVHTLHPHQCLIAGAHGHQHSAIQLLPKTEVLHAAMPVIPVLNA